MPKMLRKPVAAPPKARVRQLTIFLLRETISSIEEALDPKKVGPTVTPYEVPAVKGRLFVGDAPGKEPKWISFVKGGVTGKLKPLRNHTVSAALIFEAGGRFFAVTFGFGRYFLKQSAFVLDFGLKATLNTVDPKKLRSMDTRTFEEATVHTRRQASRSSPMDTFSVDVVRDVMGGSHGRA